MTLHHLQQDRIPLHTGDMKEVMKHMHNLWRFDVKLESIQDGKVTSKYECNEEVLKQEEVKAAG